MSPTLPVSGSGVLFTAVFRARTDVTASPITLTYAKLVDRTGASLPVTMAGAAVPEPAAATAAPTTLATIPPATEAPATIALATAAPIAAPETGSGCARSDCGSLLPRYADPCVRPPLCCCCRSAF